jgi:acetamidase/formamidase
MRPNRHCDITICPLLYDFQRRDNMRFTARQNQMNARRQFIAQTPFGLFAAFVAPGAWSQSARMTADGASGGMAAASAKAPSPPTRAVGPAADGPLLRWIPKREDLAYTFGGAAPRQRIQPGTRIVTWTEDCFGGVVQTAADLPSKLVPEGHDNAQTGPFFVEGAEPGDTLAVRILNLQPARAYGVSAFSPGFGALVSNYATPMLGPELPETTWRYDIDTKRNVARTTSRDGRYSWEVPIAPFLGCLGVAPSGGEVRSSIDTGPFGGNMDCPEVRAGNTVFFGVNVPGALVSFGDGHYAMGDGEIMGAAIEGALNVELVVDLIKGTGTPIPRIENEDEVMFVGSGRPLEDAARIAFKAMIGWVRDASGLSELDAYQFVSQNAKAPIIQLVDPQYTVLVNIEKKRIPARRR